MTNRRGGGRLAGTQFWAHYRCKLKTGAGNIRKENSQRNRHNALPRGEDDKEELEKKTKKREAGGERKKKFD